MKSFNGEKLKEARKAAGLSQMALALETGRHINTIRKWESGSSEPSVSDAFTLASACGVGVSFFLAHGVASVSQRRTA